MCIEGVSISKLWLWAGFRPKKCSVSLLYCLRGCFTSARQGWAIKWSRYRIVITFLSITMINLLIDLTEYHTAEIKTTTASQSVSLQFVACMSKYTPSPYHKALVWATGEENGCESGCPLEKRKKMSGTKGHKSDGERELALASKAEEIVDKKGSLTSIICKWFGYIKWLRWSALVVPTKKGNTTNLFHHLKRYHPSDHTESMKMPSWTHVSPPTSFVQRPSGSSAVGSASRAVTKQQSIVSSFTAIAPYEKRSKRTKDITSTVSFLIVKDTMTLSTVEKDGFRKLIKVLDSRYKLPDKKYFSQTALPHLYKECYGKHESMFAKLNVYI